MVVADVVRVKVKVVLAVVDTELVPVLVTEEVAVVVTLVVGVVRLQPRKVPSPSPSIAPVSSFAVTAQLAADPTASSSVHFRSGVTVSREKT